MWWPAAAALLSLLWAASVFADPCALVVVDPQDEFLSNRGLVKHRLSDARAEALADRVIQAIEDGCRVYITASMTAPQSCSFLSEVEMAQPATVEWFSDAGHDERLKFSQFELGSSLLELETGTRALGSPENPLRDVPWMLLRLSMTRQLFNECDERGCEKGCIKCPDDPPDQCSNVEYLPEDVDQCPESSAPRFPPNRVMAPGGGGGFSLLFTKALHARWKAKEANNKGGKFKDPSVFVVVRGFTGEQTDTEWGSLVDPKLVDDEKLPEGEERPPARRCVYSLNVRSLEALNDHTGEILTDGLCGQSADEAQQLAYLMRHGPKTWREMGSPITKEEAAECSVEDDGMEITDGINEDFRTVMPYSDRLSLAHACESPIGPSVTASDPTSPKASVGSRLIGCSDDGTNPDKYLFDDFLLNTADLAVDICGFGLDFTIRETASVLANAKQSGRSISVLSHLSWPIFNPDRLKSAKWSGEQLPTQMPPQTVADFLVLQGTKIDHGETFSVGGASGVDGWHAVMSANEEPVEQPEEDLTVKKLDLVNWDCGGLNRNPFEFKTDMSKIPNPEKMMKRVIKHVYPTLMLGMHALLSPHLNLCAPVLRLPPTRPKLRKRRDKIQKMKITDVFTENMWEELSSRMRDSARSCGWCKDEACHWTHDQSVTVEESIDWVTKNRWNEQLEEDPEKEHVTGWSAWSLAAQREKPGLKPSFLVSAMTGGLAYRGYIEVAHELTAAVPEPEDETSYNERPGPLSCYQGDMQTTDWEKERDLTWQAWLDHMFGEPKACNQLNLMVLRENPPPRCARIQPDVQSCATKAKCLEMQDIDPLEHVHNKVLQVTTLAIFDTIIQMIASQFEPRWKMAQSLMCIMFSSKVRAYKLMHMTDQNFPGAEVIMLQDATHDIVRQSTVLMANYEVTIPTRPDLKRIKDGFPIIALQREVWISESDDSIEPTIDVSMDVLKKLSESTGESIEDGALMEDLLVLTAMDRSGGKYLLCTFKTDEFGVPAVRIIEAIKSKYDEVLEEDTSVRLIVTCNAGTDAQHLEDEAPEGLDEGGEKGDGDNDDNINDGNEESALTLNEESEQPNVKVDEANQWGVSNDRITGPTSNEFIEKVEELGLVFASRREDALHTMRSHRTYLQAKLKDSGITQGRQDFIIFSSNLELDGPLTRDNTGKATFNPNLNFPTSDFPSDHIMLKARLKVSGE